MAIMQEAAPIPGATKTQLFGGAVLLEAYGKYYPNISGRLEVQDWSLRSFTGEYDARPDHSVTKYLPEIGRRMDTAVFLAPSPKEFNAKICTEEELTQHITLTSPAYGSTAQLWRGAFADGIVLGSGQAFANSPGGCPLIAVLDRKRGNLGVIHAGRDSLIDAERIRRIWLNDKSAAPREHESVVMSLFEAMGIRDRTEASALQAAILFPIEASVFTHPWKNEKYGAFNRARSEDTARRWGAEAVPGFEDHALREEGRLDLGILSRLQLQSLGVELGNIEILEAPDASSWYTTRSRNGETTERDIVVLKYV